MLRRYTPILTVLALSLVCTGTGLSRQGTVASPTVDVWPLEWVDQIALPVVDLEDVSREDVAREAQGLAPRYAIPHAFDLDVHSAGTWEPLRPGYVMWRLRVRAPGATSLNFGFREYHLPLHGRLLVYSSDEMQALRPFTVADNEEHGQLWTPVVLADDVVLELTVPEKELPELRLRLSHVGYGYRGFGAPPPGGAPESGSCNVDVVCPEGDAWRNEIPSVGVISTGGSTFCTGFLVNNTAQDRKPFFMTAYHCGIGAGNAASLVVYWNYETSVCGGTPDGVLSDFNTGSYWRAAYAPTDFTLVELDDDPDPAYEVTFSGWDATGVVTPSAVGIHHPNTDEKRISFEYQPTSTTSYLGTAVPGDGTHVRITDWDLGTTEPGSSGSPLFDQNHRIIGQLHGGYASCTSQTSDWYGKLARSWSGGGTVSSRLSSWLDPLSTGQLVLDTLGISMTATPAGEVVHAGPVGGPFTTPSMAYTLTNVSTSPIDYRVSLTSSYGLLLLDGDTAPVSGTLAPGGGTVQIAVALDAACDGLASGVYVEDVQIADLTGGTSSQRRHVLEVGRVQAHAFHLDTDPGWSGDGQWAYGVPTGGGGTAHGNPDPTSGHTGTSVYGYALSGDYPDNMPQHHLTSTALDCSGLQDVELRFARWLNVEQPAYDHASLSVSNDGIGFVTIWQNGSEITDSAWTQQVYDISAIADDQPTVYLRWTMGSTDGSWRYSGWNVDDVELVAFPVRDCNGNGVPDDQDISGGTSADGNRNGVPDECEVGAAGPNSQAGGPRRVLVR